ncbi:hypothetical protein BGZ96_005316 [Linnemannia gamsii]|uniref:ABC transporter domain-containing protein n=1 Tax=Linnemannia gamsii TaxID=64522 RepID=A0ABQ7K5R8_9FUNG|nr:hypothetical protein BGZ96_005316 [Linnemannia gamsii]
MAVYIVFGVMVGIVFWKLDEGIVGIRGRSSVVTEVYLYSAMAMLAIAFERDFDRAALISGSFYICSSLMAGFIIPTNQIPRGVSWIKTVSFHRLAYQTWTSLEFTDRRFDCPFHPTAVSASNGNNTVSLNLWDPARCAPFEGNTILVELLQVETHARQGGKSSLGEKVGGQSLENKESLKNESEVRVDFLDQVQSQHQPPSRVPVTIRIVNLSLALVKRGLFEIIGIYQPYDEARKILLGNIDIVIAPAKLTAILGGSSSGKTTFLNALLNRTQDNVQITGDIYFNGTKNPSIRQINTVSAYVRQGDGTLMTHLTVRKTLHYAVELGMNKNNLSAAQKSARVEEVIELMGLQDGLDALTALSVMQTLKKIALSGRTVVCKIHQPRVDIWDEFDDVLLLVSGGRLAYAGRPDQAMDHFERAGYSLPLYTNLPGLRTTVASAAVMVLVNFAYITAGESFGIAYSSYFASNAGLGVTLVNSTILWLSFLAGVLIVKLPPILQVVNLVSIFRYASISTALEEFRGLEVNIPEVATTSLSPRL